MNNRKGFTLIEMLVVVAIIGLLASVVVVGVGSARQRARDARRISDIRQIQNLLENYYSVNNAKYPADQTAFNGIPGLPKDPLAAKVYGYAVSGTDQQRYFLGACLEDVKPAGVGHVKSTLVPTNLASPASCDCNVDDAPTLKLYCVGS